MRILSTFAALVLLTAVLAAAQAQNGNDLFLQGEAKMFEQDFAGAIQIFDRIAKEFGSDRSLVAQAAVQRGRAQELLGLAEAQDAYTKALQRDPNHNEARQRLSDVQRALRDVRPYTIFIADLDPKGNVRGRPSRLTSNYNDREALPTWSPDGKRIAYAKLSAPKGPEIVVHELATGLQKNLGRLPQNGPSLWFPDSRSLLSVEGTAGQEKGSIVRIDIDKEKGARTSLVTGIPLMTNGTRVVSGFNLNFAALSPDGKSIYALISSVSGDDMTLTAMKFDTVTGQQDLLRQLPTGSIVETQKQSISLDIVAPTRLLAISPDGQAFATERAHRRDGGINIRSLAGSDGQDSFKVLVEGVPVHGVAWCKDRIFFGKYADEVPADSRAVPGNWQIMQVPADGSGPPVFTGLEVRDNSSFDLTQDCSRIVFDAREYRISNTSADVSAARKVE